MAEVVLQAEEKEMERKELGPRRGWPLVLLLGVGS